MTMNEHFIFLPHITFPRSHCTEAVQFVAALFLMCSCCRPDECDTVFYMGGGNFFTGS